MSLVQNHQKKNQESCMPLSCIWPQLLRAKGWDCSIAFFQGNGAGGGGGGGGRCAWVKHPGGVHP